MSSYADIAAEIRKLRAARDIEVKYYKDTLVDASKIETLRGTLESVFDIKCPPSIAASVEIDDELNAYWRAKGKSDDDAVFGEFFLRSVLLFGPENELNPVFLDKDYGAVDLKDTRVFDYYSYHGGPIHALLPVKGNTIEDRVLIFNEREVSTTSLDYAGYLELVQLTRGFLFWQYLFCDRIKVEEHEMRELRKGLAFVEATFPGDDHSALRERLKRLDKRK